MVGHPYQRILLLAVSVGILGGTTVGCTSIKQSSVDDSTDDTYSSHEKMQAATLRARNLDWAADLLITWESRDDYSLDGKSGTRRAATDDTLGATASSATEGRDLAVVDIGKLVRYEFKEPRLREEANRIEAVLRAQGFKRVEFHLLSAFGHFPYRK